MAHLLKKRADESVSFKSFTPKVQPIKLLLPSNVLNSTQAARKTQVFEKIAFKWACLIVSLFHIYFTFYLRLFPLNNVHDWEDEVDQVE